MVLQVLLQLVVSVGRLGLAVSCWILVHFQASELGQQPGLAELEEEVEVVAPDFERHPGLGWAVWTLVSLRCSG